MIPASSSFLSSLCSDGQETFISIAHLETDLGMEAIRRKYLLILAKGI